MSKVAITEQYLSDIADAIREKTGLSTATYRPSEMASAILTISGGGGITPTGTINITSNGTYNVTQYASAAVAVPTGATINNQDKSVTPTESAQTVTYDSGYTGLESVSVGAISKTYVGSSIARKSSTDLTVSGATVTAPAGYYSANASKAVATGSAGTPTATKGTVSNHSVSITPSVTNTTGYITGSTKTGTAVTVSASELVSGTKSITANGTGIDVTNYASIDVNVGGGSSPVIDSLSVTPSESEQTFNSSSVDGYKPVTVGAISSTYVGSGITRKSSTDLSASGATVTVPVGYYASQATKSVSTMTLPTSATTSATSGYTSKATISRSTSDQYINIPTGYNTAGGYYKISAVANGTVTAPSTISGTSATVSTGTNTLTLSKTVSVTPNVSTAGYISAGTAGNSTVSLTASVTTKAAATITPGTTSQTIAAGTYLTGAQTIAGDADLVASNIVSGVQIFGVTGNVVLQSYYTGSSVPSSSLGQNGDIYLQV